MTTQDYNEAVETYADALYRLAYRTLKDHQASQDVVQDVFTKVWLKSQQLKADELKAYLFTAAYNRSVDLYRSKKTRMQYSQNLSETLSDAIHTQLEEVDLLEYAMERITDMQRKLIILRDLEGYSYEEIAELTSLNLSQVKVYLYRARKALKDIIHTHNLTNS